MTRTLALLLGLLLFATACSDETDATSGDAGHEVGVPDSGTGPTDAGGNNVADADSDADSDAQLADSGPDAAADMATDAEVDAATPDAGDPFEGRPLGQCAVDDDCPENPNGKVCNRRLPGGACGNCGNDTVCDDTCFVGTCVTTCSTTDDCPPGLRCTGAGRCGAVRCSNGVCPIPLFGCSASEFCERIDCSTDASVCPDQTSCVDGVCIEDRFGG